MFTAFVLLIALLVPVVVVLASTIEVANGISINVAVAAVSVGGVISLVAPRLVERPLDCTNDASLAQSFRQRLLLRVAFAGSAAVIGFVVFVATGEPGMYGIGFLFAAVGHLRSAPTRRSVVRDQEALATDGCGRSLVGALGVSNQPHRQPGR